MYKYIFMFVYKLLQGLSKFFHSFFLSGMFHLSGFITLDKFLNFEAHDYGVFKHMSTGLLNLVYCELEELFVLLLYGALVTTEINGSSNVTLH
jgi:hypothetical protein